MSQANQSVWVTLPPITAGALATAAIMYPVDLLRALRMASSTEAKQSTLEIVRKFVRLYGISGLFRQGVVPEMARATWMRVLKFFLFPITHRAMYDKDPSKGSGITRAIAGAVCSIPETISIVPIEMSKIGLQLDKENKFKNKGVAAIQHIYRTQGLMGLMTSYAGVQYRQASWTGAYFGSLNYFTDKVNSAQMAIIGKKSDNASQLLGGFAAGVFGAVFNTPGDVVRTVIQKRAFEEVTKPKITPAYLWSGVTALFVVGSEIVAKKGVKGLYFGFGFKAIHLGGSGALLATLVPGFKHLMGVTKE